MYKPRIVITFLGQFVLLFLLYRPPRKSTAGKQTAGKGYCGKSQARVPPASLAMYTKGQQ